MGQYHVVVNLDKQQFIHPHRMGDGLKLMEFGSGGIGGTTNALAILLASACKGGGRGGGDIHHDIERTVGSWAGDRIAVVGDYGEPGDLPDGNGDIVYPTCADSQEEFDERVTWLREDGHGDEATRLETLGRFIDISQVVKDILFMDGYVTYKTAEWGGTRRATAWDSGQPREEFDAARAEYAKARGLSIA